MSRDYRQYTVRPGDTLGALAKRFGTTVSAIFQASTFRSGNPNLIYVGEIANIPENPEDPANKTRPRDPLPEDESDEVSVIIGGAIFTGWQSAEISRAIDNAASGFSIAGPFNPDRQELVSAFRPYSYQQVAIYIGRELVMTGRHELVTAGITAGDRTFNVQGRSLPGRLVDCTVDADGWEYNGTLYELSREFCRPFSIPVSLEGPDTPAVSELRAEPGQRYFEFLKTVADAHGKLLTDNAQGGLVIRTQPEKGTPVASIIEGETDINSITGEYNGAERFSKYTVMTQYAGTPDLAATASDPGVGVYRPFARVGSTAEFQDIETAAKWERSLGLSRSVQVSVTLPTWRHSKGKWDRGQTVTVKAPSAFILRETDFVIASVSLSISDAGKSASLRLVLPETYAGGLPSREPWV
jgi:prophage tail gpP-like protein